MKENITGCIYKITCIPNGKFYIGLTIQKPEIRWSSHKANPNKKMKIDIEEYGWDNFKKEVLFENIPKGELGDFEIDIISSLNPYYNTSNGGETGNGLSGENTPTAKLKEVEVIEIRYKYANENITYEELGNIYNVLSGTISKICLGHTWKDTPGITHEKFTQRSDRVGGSKLRTENIIYIRNSVHNNTETIEFLANKFSLTEKYIKAICNGRTWKHVGGHIEPIKKETTKEQVIQIRNEYSNTSITALASKYDKDWNTISRIVYGETFKNIGGKIAKKNKRLTEVQVIDIRNRSKFGDTVSMLMELYHKSKNTIIRVINKETFVDIGGPIRGVDY